jgi:hypothetical protein
MVSGHTGNVVPRKGLRVRAPCPPLDIKKAAQRFAWPFAFRVFVVGVRITTQSTTRVRPFRRLWPFA